jgi:DNA modification methylase
LLYRGDCLEILKQLEENSVDSLVTDPPAGISFMGRDWDSGNNFIPAMTEVFKEVLRVLKPGAHGLVWALPRTSHWTASALELAGFEIRDVITHLFGSGFPKSHDISKGIDKAAGAEREVIGIKTEPNGRNRLKEAKGVTENKTWGAGQSGFTESIEKRQISAPSTPEAKQWQGWGTALKPASEHWILIRKPLSEKTVAANVLKHGTGGINIDASRIEGGPKTAGGCQGNIFGNKADDLFRARKAGYSESPVYGTGDPTFISTPPTGRFPANLVLSHNEDCQESCTESCAVKMLDEQSGYLHGAGNKKETDEIVDNGIFSLGKIKRPSRTKNICDMSGGGASRFFYVAKASKRDRNEGLETGETKRSDYRPNDDGTKGLQSRLHGATEKTGNHHPTVKSTKLMEYLITLVTPPNGIVLDPFMGSGSTGVAAKRLGFEFIGIEKEQEYFEIAEKRISA